VSSLTSELLLQMPPGAVFLAGGLCDELMLVVPGVGPVIKGRARKLPRLGVELCASVHALVVEVYPLREQLHVRRLRQEILVQIHGRSRLVLPLTVASTFDMFLKEASPIEQLTQSSRYRLMSAQCRRPLGEGAIDFGGTRLGLPALIEGPRLLQSELHALFLLRWSLLIQAGKVNPRHSVI